MPNWCYNRLTVQGQQDELNRFVSAIKAVPQDGLNDDVSDVGDPEAYVWLNQLVPLDPRSSATRTVKNQDGEDITFSVFAEPEQDGFDGYAHAVERWGSKWGACRATIVDSSATKVQIRFDSAWGPADKLIQTISGQFPTLVFGLSFTEEADFFAGYIVFLDGELSSSADFSTDIPQEIVDLQETDEDKYYDELMEYQDSLAEEIRQAMEQDVEDILHDMSEGVK